MGNRARRYEQLEGLRGILIILVVTSHTAAFGMYGQGGLAVNGFFCLSGFLMMLSVEGKCFFTVAELGKFYLKRFLKLIPVYWIVLVAVYIFYENPFIDITTFLKNILLIDVYGHLWFFQQIIFINILFPIIVLFCSLLRKFGLEDIHIAVVIMIISLGIRRFMGVDVFYLMGNGKKLPFQISLFLIGVSFHYFYRWMQKNNIHVPRMFGEIVACLLVAGCFLSAASILKYINPKLGGYYVGYQLVMLSTLLFGVLIVILIDNDGIISSILRKKIFTSLGSISFEIYLIHYFLLPQVEFLSAGKKFFYILLFSVALGNLVSKGVEKPLLTWVKKII